MTSFCLVWHHIDQRNVYSIDCWELPDHTRVVNNWTTQAEGQPSVKVCKLKGLETWLNGRDMQFSHLLVIFQSPSDEIMTELYPVPVNSVWQWRKKRMKNFYAEHNNSFAGLLLPLLELTGTMVTWTALGLMALQVLS